MVFKTQAMPTTSKNRKKKLRKEKIKSKNLTKKKVDAFAKKLKRG